jgi:hypothetical protein
MLKLWKRGFIIGVMNAESKSRIQGIEYPEAMEILAAVEYGIDISMLIDNIRRSYSERIKRHQIALNTVEKLKGARKL